MQDFFLFDTLKDQTQLRKYNKCNQTFTALNNRGLYLSTELSFYNMKIAI